MSAGGSGMTWDVTALLERFSLFSGLSEEEAQKQKVLCEDAAAQVEGMAKFPLTPAQEAALYGAAAALAYYRWALLEGARGPESFSAGDVQVKKDKALVETARALWQEYRRAAASCLDGGGFVFSRVQKTPAGFDNGGVKP